MAKQHVNQNENKTIKKVKQNDIEMLEINAKTLFDKKC